MKCIHENSLGRIATLFFWVLSDLVLFFYRKSHSLWSFKPLMPGGKEKVTPT